MVILITGDRNWADEDVVARELIVYPSDATTIVHGNCRGIDKTADKVATVLGMKVISVPADWQLYGKRAGPIRNRYMLDTYHPDLVLAFHQHIEDSKGTKDMINYAKSKNVPVKLIEK